MTLLLIDGFDHYTAATYAGMSVITPGKSTYSPGRFGDGRYLQGNSTSFTIPTTSSDTVIIGIALRAGSATGGWNFIVGNLILSSARVITALRLSNGATVLATSNTGLIYYDVWNYLEMKIKFHASSGTVAVRLNGVSVPNISDLTGLNTGTKPTFFAAEPDSWVTQANYDDLYVADINGSVNNDFLGDVRVEALYPVGTGSATGWSPVASVSGTANWQTVDEYMTNDDTDYVTASGVGNKDLYAMSDLSTTIGGSVLGVQINTRVKKSDSGTRGIAGVFKTGASEADGTTFGTIATDWQWFHDLREDKPGGTGWTIAEVNAMEAGIKITV